MTNQPTTGPLEWDDDGNALPQPEPRSDLADLIQLVEYARRRGFRIGPMVRVGKLTLQIHDMRQTEGGNQVPGTPEPNIWKEHGYDEDQ